jgi:hypothetical protein
MNAKESFACQAVHTASLVFRVAWLVFGLGVKLLAGVKAPSVSCKRRKKV